MQVPDELKYTKEHEWVRVEGDVVVVGITDHAQDQLGDVVYVELPEANVDIEVDAAFGTVESVKAVSDLFAPISGKVVEINADLPDNPEAVNQDPYGTGWMIKIMPAHKEDIDDLMSADEYAALAAQS